MSVSESAKKAEIERNRQATIAEEANYRRRVLRTYLAQKRRRRRANAHLTRRDSNQRATRTKSLLAADNVLEDLVDFDFTSLTTAKVDAVQRKCLAQAIYYEARSEKRVGQLAVADVVLNRVASRYIPEHDLRGCVSRIRAAHRMPVFIHLRRVHAGASQSAQMESIRGSCRRRFSLAYACAGQPQCNALSRELC